MEMPTQANSNTQLRVSTFEIFISFYPNAKVNDELKIKLTGRSTGLTVHGSKDSHTSSSQSFITPWKNVTSGLAHVCFLTAWQCVSLHSFDLVIDAQQRLIST